MDTNSTTSRYFTLMPNVPMAINREEALSLLASVSSVKSLHLLHLYKHGAFWQRVGLVEVSDKESVFRLTSRQFLLRDFHVVKHVMIPHNSILAYEFGDLDVCMHLSYYSRDNSAMSRIIDFFEQFGSLNILSMKSKEGMHELTFRASKDYSIRHHSTNLRFKVDEVFVEVHFPEEKLNYDYIAHDPYLRGALADAPLLQGKPFAATTDYFNPKPTDSRAFEVPVGHNRYLVEDDCLSQDEEDDFDLDVLEEAETRITLADHFSSHRTVEFLAKHTFTVTGKEAHQSKFDRCCKDGLVSQLVKEVNHVKKNRTKKKKNQREIGLKEKSSIVDKDSKQVNKKKKDEFKLETEIPRDGKALLSLVWSSPQDFQTINSRVMPEIHSKWRRFVEIKDEMRRQKYQDYLSSKQGSCLQTETGENNLSAIAEAKLTQ